MKIRVGGHSANALLDMISSRGIELNDHAKRYMNDLRYSVSVVSTSVEIKFVTAAELGFENGSTLKEIQASSAWSPAPSIPRCICVCPLPIRKRPRARF